MPKGEPPSWIDEKFFLDVLRRNGDADAEVTSVTLEPVCGPEDNYNSLLFRIKAETNSGTQSAIVKILPPGHVSQGAIKEGKFFERESLMLHEIIPRMHKHLEDAAPGKFAPFSAKCLYYEHGSREFLVIEDLSPQGFRLADRHRGLGLRHSLLALRTLARFHAASVAVLSEDKSLLDKLPNPFRSIKSDTFRNYAASLWQNIADTCRKWSHSSSKYADDIEALKDKAFERYTVNNDYKPGRFNVIAHGDFWLNNTMMRYEEGELKDIRLVDLQVTHITSPAIDILYFLHSSVSEDVSRHHTDLLIREYYVTLKETMTLLRLEAPSFQEILEELKENGFFATFSTFGVLPIVKAKKVPDFEKSLADGAQQNDFLFTNPTVQRWLQRLIPEYSRNGFLS